MKIHIAVIVIITSFLFIPSCLDKTVNQEAAKETSEVKQVEQKIEETTSTPKKESKLVINKVETTTPATTEVTKIVLEFREMTKFEMGIVEAVNAERIKAGISVLQIDSNLNAAALYKVQNIIETGRWRHALDNYGSTMAGVLIKVGYRYSLYDENLAKDFATPEETVRAWMESPTHKKNILDSRMIKVGVANKDGVTALLLVK
jgi:uncharacterized protein YkwD